MNNRRLLIASVYNFVHSVEKVKNITSWHKTLLASTISKQVSRCCIHFLLELTSQILTNQSIKIGRRAWPWWEKSKATVFSACNSWLNFRVRGQFEIKIIMMRHITKHNLFHIVSYEFFKKNWITSKNNTRSLWTRDTVRWYWSLDTLLWQLSIDHNIDVQYECDVSLLGSQTTFS